VHVFRQSKTIKRSKTVGAMAYGYNAIHALLLIIFLSQTVTVQAWSTKKISQSNNAHDVSNFFRSSSPYHNNDASVHSSSNGNNHGLLDVESRFNSNSVHPLCFYRSPINGRWTKRVELQNLFIGQERHGIIVQEKLTNTTTGPKIWLDVGVCRWSSKSQNKNGLLNETINMKGNWKICTALLRLGNGNYVKESVIRKKVARLRSKAFLSVYVSRIFINEGRFEVVLTPEEVPTQSSSTLPLQSVSKLSVGNEVNGTITRIEDYGVFVQMDGYNRCGLLHIQHVADLYNSFIDKKQGLIDAGLGLRSRIKLQVKEKDVKKRIFLDFTNDVKEIAAEEQQQQLQEEERQQDLLRAQLLKQRENPASIDNELPAPDPKTIYNRGTSIELEKPITVPISIPRSTVAADTDGAIIDEMDDNEYDDEESEYDNYDEEREIEDALGLGSY
jgi:predicted RNA-binding protein with RPS1 domain